MRVLQIGADRSKRGILFLGTPAFLRQEAYARGFGHLDIIGFSRRLDGAQNTEAGALHIYPTNSRSRLGYMRDAIRISQTLPKPDVVSAQDPFETGFTAWLIARRLKVPLHVQVHTDFLSAGYTRHSLKNSLRRMLAGFVLKRATRVRVVSQSVKESFETYYRLRTPVTVLPIFVDVAQFRAAAHPALTSRFAPFRMRLLVVARLEPEKNIPLAIEAFATSADTDSCLIIVGDGSERLRLGNLAKAAGVSGRIFFEGERDAAAYYALADLVLVTSKYEGYGLVIIEALAAGKPVLSTEVGIARESGAIVTSPDKFADTLRSWFESGPSTGTLKSYPYNSFDEYVRAYCDDIAACKKS